MLSNENLTYIGHVAVFYVPVSKLDLIQYGKDGRTPRQMFELFLMEHYNAYTLEVSNTQGCWRKNRRAQIFKDENARYEVSFGGEDKVSGFVEFLSEMCERMMEESIYVTMGHKSYLVWPKNNEIRNEV